MEICNLSLQDPLFGFQFMMPQVVSLWKSHLGLAHQRHCDFLFGRKNGYISIHVLPDEWIQKTHPILGNQPPNPSNLHHLIAIAPSKISRFVHVLLNGTSAPLRYQWHPTKPGRFPPPAREDVSDLWEPENGMLCWIGQGRRSHFPPKSM